ncbi:MAG: hypothetical protein WDO68_19400 [Gammaproteobacteria bacterium]
MPKIRSSLAVLLLALGATPCVTYAADDAAALRAELDALKQDYANRVGALEARINQLETAQSAVAVASTPPPPLPAAESAPGSGGARGGQSAFNPAISMILAGNYASLSADPSTYRIAGFLPSGGEVGPGERSFNLGESELTVAANVDPYFFANVTASVTADNEIAVEEAYFRTLALHDGFTVKGGRFFSGLGYLNEIHAHAWDFVDQPLIYQAFFGGQLAQDGLQVKWLAPTDTFMELGAEAGNGDRFPANHRDRNGLNGTTLFAHVGGDIGDSTSWRTGLSWNDSRSDDRGYEDVDAFGVPVENAFTGTARTWVVDALMKWSPNGDSTRRQLKLQGEYMRRTEDGQLAFDTTGTNLLGDYRNRQSGWYVQGVYLFQPRWRIGARYDSLDSGDARIGLVQSGALTRAAFPTLLSASPERFTIMLDWSPSEFSRLRGQYAWDESRLDERDRQFQLQYIYSIGAHGAHKF